MAEKKEAAAKAPATTSTTKREPTVKIRLPRIEGEESVFVSVNERTWLIKRGVDVEVPECVAAQLRYREEMEEKAYEYKLAAQK